MKSGGTSFGRAVTALAFVFVALSVTASAAESAGGIRIVASLFPQYDFARRIAGDKADIRLLLPPGSESHSYEPTPSDMKDIAGADLFVYTGAAMEPWAERMAEAAAGSGGVRIVDASAGIALHREGDADAHHAESGPDAHYHEFDPHIWLDPVLATVMVDNIAAAVAAADPANAGVYRNNAQALKNDLSELDANFRKTVAAAPRRTLVFGGRFAFGYLFERYGLEMVGPYKFCAPGAEPGLKAVIAVIEYIKANQVRFVYREAMSAGRIGEVLRQETGVEVLAVDSLHNLSAEALRAGASFIDVMRANLDAFARGLE